MNVLGIAAQRALSWGLDPIVLRSALQFVSVLVISPSHYPKAVRMPSHDDATRPY